MQFLTLILNEGKPLSYVLLGAFAVATFLFFYRFFYLHSINIDCESFLLGIKNNLRKNKIVEAISICNETNTPVASVCESILSRESKVDTSLRMAADEVALIELPRLQQNCRLIAALGQLCPMLGLFGTIISFIKMFGKLDQGGASLSIGPLAEDVKTALITTAIGVAAGMIIHLYNIILDERCHAIVYDMEKTATELINFIVEPSDFSDKLNAEAIKGSDSSKA